MREPCNGRKLGQRALWLGSLLLILFIVQAAWAAPKLSPKAKPGDCAACHGKAKVLPDGHVDPRSMNWEACQACHKDGKMALVGKMSGGHLHLLSGVTCAQCHGKTAKPKAVKADKCAACHGSPEKLAEKTAKVKPENPHTSPHYGTTLDCGLCHHQHAKSEDYCGQCHQFKFRTP
jgi:DnaJ-class molecular chaperone